MASTDFSIHSDLAALERLSTGAIDGDRNVVFLIGAPAAAPIKPNGPGIPGTSGMVQLIRNELKNSPDALNAFEAYISGRSLDVYQRAFDFYIANRGQSAANRLIQNAVIHAREGS